VGGSPNPLYFGALKNTKRMKHSRMVPLFLLLMGILTFRVACGQDYLVTAKNDTLPGKTKMLNFNGSYKVQLTADGQKRKTYEVYEVKAFRLENEMYHTVRHTSGYAFMRLLKPGYLSLYAFQESGQVNWDGRMLVKADGSTQEVPNLGFKKRMSVFLGDCAEVRTKIELGAYSRSNIEQAIDEYNQCIAVRSAANQEQIKQAIIQTEKGSAWTELEQAVDASDDFAGKQDAADMIREVKLKLSRQEKIPNFLLEGLRASLKDQAKLAALLDKAIGQL
jgi:hypothetical protein